MQIIKQARDISFICRIKNIDYQFNTHACYEVYINRNAGFKFEIFNVFLVRINVMISFNTTGHISAT